MITDVLRNVNLFVDGRGYAGTVEEVNLPKLTVATEEHRGGGMDAPAEIDMGLEKLECDWSCAAIDAEMLKAWGVAPGNAIPATFRGALESEDGTVKAVEVRVRGAVKEVDWGAWKPGEKAPLKCMMAVRYYKLTHDGSVIHEIDVDNMKRIVNGTDRLAEQRAALGI